MSERYFKLAKRLCSSSDHHQHRLACVIVKKNKIISVGYNTLKTHPNSPHPFRSTHAEFAAANKANSNDLKGATVYVFREHRNGSPALARPCYSCYNYLVGLGVKEICYSTYGGYEKEAI